MPDLTIEAGNVYKTRDGYKARVYATDGEVDGDNQQPIHGAYLLCGSWYSTVWRGDGKQPLRENNEFDLVAPWVDPPVVDWAKFPKFIVAIARTKDGEWQTFNSTPELREELGEWGNFGDDFFMSGSIWQERLRPKFTGDWRDSLAIRPSHEPYKQPFPPYDSNEPTPGPWRIGNGSCVVADGLTGHDDPRTVESYGGHLVCESATRGNLQLIAAAWEMYEACKSALSTMQNEYTADKLEAKRRLHSAICTADGIPF